MCGSDVAFAEVKSLNIILYRPESMNTFDFERMSIRIPALEIENRHSGLSRSLFSASHSISCSNSPEG